MRQFKTAAKDEGTRVDVFLAAKYPEFTRSSLSGLFDKGLINVNGRPAKRSHSLKAGDELEVDDRLLRTEPPIVELPIIYEDADVVVMDKPAGLLTHSKGALNLEPTVASFLKTKITDSSLTGNRAGIAHRLDRGTSGVIIGAKTEPALKWLQKQFSTRKTKKTYLAVVEGQPEPAEAIIHAPIERNPRRPQTFRVGAGGKPAQTAYKVLSTAEKNGKLYSLLELTPVTGRTHQLRVHLAYIGHPIVGDRIYGRMYARIYVGRPLLHAKNLELRLPGGQTKAFTVKEPAEFEEFLRG